MVVNQSKSIVNKILAIKSTYIVRQLKCLVLSLDLRINIMQD